MGLGGIIATGWALPGSYCLVVPVVVFFVCAMKFYISCDLQTVQGQKRSQWVIFSGKTKCVNIYIQVSLSCEASCFTSVNFDHKNWLISGLFVNRNRNK